ncbi:MAG: hypothetical protein R3E50_05795 [Halioglobus sp.]
MAIFAAVWQEPDRTDPRAPGGLEIIMLREFTEHRASERPRQDTRDAKEDADQRADCALVRPLTRRKVLRPGAPEISTR